MTRLSTLSNLPSSSARNFSWINWPFVQRICNALEAASPECVRFVGGCVRDSLIGVTPIDFDLATSLTPEAVMAAAAAARIKAVPTGIAHGTVTLVVDHHGVEVTTLRSDIETDGRHAKVAFTDSWWADAARRDFTMNAIYLTPDGKFFDPFGGYQDIKKKRVAFIGDPEKRICEDYLRILRFFRFTSRFGNAPDPAGLEACRDHRDGLDQISDERVTAEFLGILALPRAADGLRYMDEAGALIKISPQPAAIEAAERIKAVQPNAAAALLLAALFGDEHLSLQTRLRLSNAESAIALNAMENFPSIGLLKDDRAIRGSIYRLGKDYFEDAFTLAYGNRCIDIASHNHMSAIVNSWTPPVLPVSGRDILALGIAPGPSVAAILDAVETAWIDEGFPSERRTREILSDIMRAR